MPRVDYSTEQTLNKFYKNQVSAAVCTRSSPIWVVTRCILIVLFRRFETANGSFVKGGSVNRVKVRILKTAYVGTVHWSLTCLLFWFLI